MGITYGYILIVLYFSVIGKKSKLNWFFIKKVALFCLLCSEFPFTS